MELAPNTPPRSPAENSCRLLHKLFRSMGMFILALTVLLFWIAFVTNTPSGDLGVLTKPQESCVVAVVPLHGTLLTYGDTLNGETLGAAVSSESIVSQIESAERNIDIKAIVLDVDSYGGIPVAAEEVAHALERSPKTTVALIRGAGLSAAYWASTGAKIIFAWGVRMLGQWG